MKLEYFDIHSHLYFQEFDSDRSEEINKIKKENIGTISVGTDLETSIKAIKLAEENEYFFATVGQHPAYIKSNSVLNSEIINLANHKKVVAIGECGFDYFRLDEDLETAKKAQRQIFEEEIKISLEIQKPLMLHIRPSKNSTDAYIDTLELLEYVKRTEGDKLLGNAHFFAGDKNILKRFLDIGFSVSFTGVITFTKDYDEFIKYSPIERIMSETDSPFVAPEPYRGKRNSPLFIKEVVNRIAEIRGEDLGNVREKLLQNAIKFFKLK